MEYFHLTTPQQNIWNLQKYYNGTAIANLCGAVFFQEKRNDVLLCKAICRFIHSQSGIRLRFSEEGEEPKQYISEEIDEDIPVRTFRSMEEFDTYAENCAKDPIGLTEGKMYRFIVFHLEQESRSGILAVQSHLISDAWTFGLLANQLDAAYRRLAGEEDMTLLEGDYADFIRTEDVYLASERYEKDKSYWKEKYPARPEESPIKLRSASTDSVEAVRITRTLSLSLEQGIATYCKRHPVTEAVLFETALIIYLSRINPDIQTVTVGVPVLNRSNAREKKIAGMFVSTTPLTVAVTGDTEILELAGQITKGHMDLFRHQKYPYAGILRQLREKQDFSGNLYDVMVSYQNAKTKTGADTKWYSNGCSEVPLLVHIDNRDGKECHTINVDYQTAVFRNEAEVELLIDRLEYILGQIVTETAEKVGDIGIVPKREYDRIVYEFNDTYVEYPREKCIHELFMEQAAKTPEQMALVFENQKFTYRQLDEMSNSLAYFLREKGVGANDVVPIIAKRSWHVVVAMLGILKAGGAYMPIDPNYPSDRIGYMLSETQVKLVLVYGCTNNGTYEVIDLAEMDYGKHTGRIENRNCSDDMCYVLYTSGSAGRPKAVCISHANMGNFNNNNNNNHYQYTMLGTCSTVLADTEFIFDISAFEIFLSLLNGLCLILTKEIMDAQYLAGLIDKHHVDALHITPTKLLTLLHNQAFQKAIAQITVLMVGAEVFTENLYQTVSRYTDAAIYNGYGPTETTIGCSFKKVNGKRSKYVHELFMGQIAKTPEQMAPVSEKEVLALADITIGTPIANTQIYILDTDQRPVPIGVPGELCIAGGGVGKGYLNRPELTAEHFVPNPFATEENHHGKVMYRTGDLARFRSDGEIEYLGRMDTQVKIRGLRIELGEIESVMGSFPGIGLCAVADKRDETGRQYLVGYYTLETDVNEQDGTGNRMANMASGVDEKALRSHLSAKLPKYMVPNYFLRLETMPMTASSKTDRKSLPVPDFAQSAREYVPPVTEKEKELCRLMEELLHAEQVGVTDDFFELGGDSLTAIEFLAKAHARGIVFALQNVFDYPTVRQLCDYMEVGDETKILYEPADFDKYQNLLAENVINEAFVAERKFLGNVLLTGATGFLGAHVLDRLLREETGKVYCLVRDGEKTGSERLQEILQYYFGDRYEAELESGQHYAQRIIPIVGDIKSEALAEDMPKDVQTVIHMAASVKHYGSYEYFNRVNVEGTRHVVNYAKSVGASLIHISTLSVSGNSLADEFAVYRSEEEKFFSETSLYIGQPLDNVYIRSKFEAERAVFDAMLDGLDAKVIRVGNLTSRASDYKFQRNYKQNAFLTRVKAILEFGLFPDYLMSLYSEFSPIDLTAEGVVKIAQYAGKQTVFHLNSNRPIYFDRFLEVVHELGIPLKVVDGDSFYQALCRTIRDRVTEYIFEAFQNDMDYQGRLLYDSNIHIENDFTVWFLKKLGFEWNEIDMEYIRGYVEYFRGIGYLEV